MAQIGNLFVKIGINMNEFEAGMRNLNKSIRDTEKQFKGITAISKRFESIGKTLTTAITLPVIGLGAAAAKSSIDLESAFAGVRKTVDATEEEFAALRKGFDNMAKKDIPIAIEELYGLGEAAGQLGIKTENILGFADTMAKLGVATNMNSNEAATALARLANITQMPQDQFDRLGSTVVALGNNLATTEREIVEMGLRLAGAGKQVGMTEAQILSFSGALSSVGIEAEAGGSAFSKLMVNMQLAVEKGGKKLDEFAKVAGISASQFQQAFREDAAGAITAFIQGLSTAEQRGMSAIAVLDSMGVSEVRMRDALLRAAGASDVFTQALALGTKAWQENNALNKEAEQRFKTTASQLQFLWNNIKILGDSFGQILLPQINELVQKLIVLAQGFSELDEGTKKIIVNVGLFAAAVGPLLILVGKLGLGFVSLAKAKALFTGSMVAGTTAAQGAATANTVLAGSLMALAGKLALVVGAIYLFKVALDDSKRGADSLGASSGILGYNMQNLKKDIDNVTYSLSEEARARKESLISVQAYTDSVESQRLKNQQAIQVQDTARQKLQEQKKALDDVVNAMGTFGEKTMTVSEKIENALSPVIEGLSLKAQIAQAKFDLFKAKLGENAEQSQVLKVQAEALNAQYNVQLEKVAALQSAYEQMKAVKGEAALETQKLYLELLKEQKAQADLAKEIANTNDDVVNAMGTFGEKTMTVSEKIENALSPVIEGLSLKAQIAQAKFDLFKAKLGENAEQSQVLKVQAEALNAQYNVQLEKVAALQSAYEQMKAVKGEAALETQKLYLELLKEQKAQADLAKEIANTNKVRQEGLTKVPQISSGASPRSIVTYYAVQAFNEGRASAQDLIDAISKTPKFATGGIIRRPVGMIDLATGKPVGMAGEAGEEAIVPIDKRKDYNLKGLEGINYDRLEAIAYTSFFEAFVDAVKAVGKGELRINIDGKVMAREMIPHIIAENQRMGVATT
ncbi:MAG: phage tail tape measure protein [Firmicutes bacterium]|nr:phage tail tape measure protein [Bacillota bacterium]